MSKESERLWKRVLSGGCRYFELYHAPWCDDENMRPYLELADQGLFVERGPTEPDGTRWQFELTDLGEQKRADEWRRRDGVA